LPLPADDQCNTTPCHFLHGFPAYLNDTLGLRIRVTDFKGDIHIGEPERDWFRQVKPSDPGGEASHVHPPLDGVIDLRGRTSLRQLVRLMYHAQGAISPVSLLMHPAAAVETPPGHPRNRPCVVVAGGREPPHFTAYPHHQFIHTVGALACCADGGCWRSRTLALGDGDPNDRPEALCVDVIDGLPRCMDLIAADEVIRRINLYFDGGALWTTRTKTDASSFCPSQALA
jgi:hypothetical protein